MRAVGELRSQSPLIVRSAAPAARLERRGGALLTAPNPIFCCIIAGDRQWGARMSGASIYILLCADGGYYAGVTRREVEERVSEHAQGLIPGAYTASRRPVKLVFSEAYERVDEAIAAERRIKGWSRAKKEAYMRGDFASLVALAKRKAKAQR